MEFRRTFFELIASLSLLLLLSACGRLRGGSHSPVNPGDGDGSFQTEPPSAQVPDDGAHPRSGIIPDRYIVVLKEGASMMSLQDSSLSGVQVQSTFDGNQHGYVANVPADVVPQLLKDPSIEFIEPDQYVSISAFEDQPDLAITAVQIAPTQTLPGQDLTIRIRIANRGTKIATNFRVSVYGNLDAPPTVDTPPSISLTGDGLYPGYAQDFVFRGHYNYAGDYRMWLRVVAGPTDQESLLGNNSAGPQIIRVRDAGTAPTPTPGVPSPTPYPTPPPGQPAPTPTPVPTASPTPEPGPYQQIIPTGMLRMGATESSARSGSGSGSVNATVAVIDTGIDLNFQEELNVTYSRSFVPGKTSANDGEGHGTHVAGIIAAKDNNVGVVGVAPGANLWAIRVLDETGSGAISQVIAGVEFVCQYPNQVQVINMSLGGGTSLALNRAVKNCVDKGIVVVVAAGNESKNAALGSPSGEPSVITVAALDDTDGLSGGLGEANKYGADDTFASFSNFGSVVDVIAPGVKIMSTVKGRAYEALSGTSMASPHVAGLAALIRSRYTTATPTDVRQMMISTSRESIRGIASDGRTYPLVSARSF